MRVHAIVIPRTSETEKETEETGRPRIGEVVTETVLGTERRIERKTKIEIERGIGIIDPVAMQIGIPGIQWIETDTRIGGVIAQVVLQSIGRQGMITSQYMFLSTLGRLAHF